MLSVMLTCLTIAFYAAAIVRMEPSVNVLSSKMWLKEVATALKEEDSIETVFVLKHCPYMMKKPFASNLLDLSTSSSSNYGKWLKVGVALY